jgi:hypothetical protein
MGCQSKYFFPFGGAHMLTITISRSFGSASNKPSAFDHPVAELELASDITHIAGRLHKFFIDGDGDNNIVTRDGEEGERIDSMECAPDNLGYLPSSDATRHKCAWKIHANLEQYAIGN